MNAERWQQIKRVLDLVQGTPDAERPGMLAEACGSDEDLRRDVESFLLYEERAEVLERMAGPPLEAPAGLVGQTVSHYQIVGVLGGGGMGRVYRAEDVRLGRHVALKFLPEETAADPVALRRFQREARAASALNHPNICTIHEIEEHHGQPFIVMELLDGQALRELVAPPLPLDRLLDLALQIAHGLEAAHQRGIVHRDIKPGNIFVTGQGQAKILDFGLAKVHGQAPAPDDPVARETPNASGDLNLSTTGVAMGTVGYMSPEQVRGEPVDARTDLFSFGLVLYEMVTGVRAFTGNSALLVQEAIVSGAPRPASELRPGVPAKLAAIIDKALQKDREQRYQSASEMAADLKKVIEAQSPRSRWLVGTVSLVGVAAALLLWLVMRSPAPPRVSRVAQLTYLGHAGPHMATDGKYVYVTYERPERYTAVQIPVAGGEPVDIPTPTRNAKVLDISPDHSELLVDGWEERGSPHTLWRIPLHGEHPRQVPGPGTGSGRWSPDGSRIVFDSDSKLWSVHPDGSGLQRLAVDAGIDSWSPDGRLIRFTRLNPAKGGSSLWELRADGSHLRPFLPELQNANARWGEGIGVGTWTPDGRYFLFREAFDVKANRLGRRTTMWAVREPNGWWPFRPSRPMEIYASGFNISAWTRPVITPDGKRLFLIGEDETREIVRYDPHLQRFVPLFPETSAEFRSFSPDAKKIAYTTFPEACLWVANRDGSERLQLTFPPDQVYGTTWSPDGKHLACHVLTPGKPGKIWLVPAEGGKPKILFENEQSGDDSPSFSPDGRLTFWRSWLDANGNTRAAGRYLVDLTTGAISPFEGANDGVRGPTWSPNGRYVALETAPGRILLSTSPPGHWKTLVSRNRVAFPRWSWDSQYVYWQDYSAAGEQLLRVHVPDGKIEKLPLWDSLVHGLPSSHNLGGLTPDGQPVVNTTRRYADIYGLDLDLP